MKKVLFVTVLALGLLAGCSSGDAEKDSGSSSNSVSEGTAVSSSEATADQFAGQSETGDGTFDLANESGNTAEGADIVVYYDAETFPTAVGIYTEDINGGLLSYIYVDGQLVTSEQLGTTQTSIELQDVPVAITEGTHTVQLVQYDTDDEGGNIVTFKSQDYTLKVK